VESQRFFTADVDAHIGAWFPILTGLASTIQDERPAVRMAASSGLFKVLEQNGGRFAPSMWVLVFRGVLSPLFDDVRHLSSTSDRTEASAVSDWAASTGSTALALMTGSIVAHLDKTRILMPDLLDLLSGWITRENEVVAREGMAALTLLVKSAGDMMTAEDWELIVAVIQKLFEQTMPHEILGPNAASSRMGKERAVSAAGDDFGSTMNGNVELGDAGNPSVKAGTSDMASPVGFDVVPGAPSSTNDKKIDFRVVRAKCVVQLLLIQLVQDSVVSFYCGLSTTSIMQLAAGVERSYSFAHDFNSDIELRRQLYLTGFMNQIPNLLKQETTGLTVYLRIIFWLYLDIAKQGEIATEPKLMALCSQVLAGFIAACDEARVKPEERREVAALVPVIMFILNGMMQMSNAQFLKHLPLMYDVLLRVVERSDERLVRASVANLFRARINPMVGFRDGDQTGALQFDPKPQIPGRVRERIFHVNGLNNNNEVAQEVQSVLIKVSGVRSAFVDAGDGSARIFASSPDEMLVSAIAGVSKVTDVVPAAEAGELESVRVAMAL
jgi:brefeldin A-inhibited guanine nucleotide-exchange protein